MNHELISCLVEYCCSLKTSNIWTVTELGLRVATNHFKLLNFFLPQKILFTWTQLLHTNKEHSKVKSKGTYTGVQVMSEKAAILIE